MAEIRTPKKQSFINRPVGVARTDAGETQAAQQLANASRTLSNATFNTASEFMRAGMEFQQDFEQRKFTEWAQKVPIVKKDGQYSNYEMPKYISGKTKSEINGILQKRFATESERRTKEYMIQARAKYANNPQEEDLFSKDVSEFTEQTAKQIEQTGGTLFAQNFRDIVSVLQSENINDIRAELSKKAEQRAVLNFEQTTLDNIAELREKTSRGDPNSLNELNALIENIKNASSDLDVSPRLQGDLIRLSQAEYSVGVINNLGFSGLDPLKRSVILEALATGNSERIAQVLPEVAPLLLPGGPLASPSVRKTVRADLGLSNSQQSRQEQLLSDRIALNNLSPYGTSVKHQEKIEYDISQIYGIARGNVDELMDAYAKNPEIADRVSDAGVLPRSVVELIEAASENKFTDPSKIFPLAQFVRDVVSTPTGATLEEIGLSKEALAFVFSAEGIERTSADPVFAMTAFQEISGTAEERQTLGRKLANSGYIESQIDYTDTTSQRLGEIALYKQDKFNAGFVQRFATVYAKIALATSVSNADNKIQEIYDAYYKDYKWAYTAGGERREQPYTLASYYGDERKDRGLRQVESEIEQRIQKINDGSLGKLDLKMGRNAFLKANDANTREYGAWVLVDAGGMPIINNFGKQIVFTTEGFKAQTAINQRMIIDAQQRAQRAADIERMRLGEEDESLRQLGKAFVRTL